MDDLEDLSWGLLSHHTTLPCSSLRNCRQWVRPPTDPRSLRAGWWQAGLGVGVPDC